MSGSRTRVPSRELMETAMAARNGGTMEDRGFFGPLPDSRTVATTFARAADYPMGAADPGHGIIESIAGLVNTHRRLEVLRPHWGDGVMTRTVGDRDIVLPSMDVDSDPFLRAWEDAQRHIAAIDLAAHGILGEPPIDAEEYHEGLGAVFCRMAYLYTISFNRFVLDGPEGVNRRQLARAYTSYDNLVHDLTCGKKYLPTPGSNLGT